MGNLQIPIVQIPRKTPLTIDVEIDTSEIENAKGAVTTLQHIRVTGSLMAIHRDFLFQGTVTGTFEGPCDRCIEPAQLSEIAEVAWLFEPGKKHDAMEEFAQSEEIEEETEFEDTDDSEPLRYYSGDDIDLEPPAKEEMNLTAPTKIYCADTCKGLCPHCGANLNQTTCDCKKEPEQNNSGLQALKDLYPDLPSNTSEE